jgi:GT2 family glycosyltransferase
MNQLTKNILAHATTSMHYVPKVSVVITTHNRKQKVIRTIESVLSSSHSEIIHEIIVVDDASTDGTYHELKRRFSEKGIKIVRCKQEQLVSKCRNIGLAKAKGEYVFFLDDDVVISSDTIFNLFKYLTHNSKVACAMPLILYYNNPNIIWSAGVRHNFWTTLGKLILHNRHDKGQLKYPILSDSVITAFMIRRSIIPRLNFDSETFPIGWEDIDFATSIKKLGYDVVVLPWVKVWHDYSNAHFITNKLRLYFEVRNRIVFHKKWSKNHFQYLVSICFSILIGLSYILLIFFFSRKIMENVKTIIKAITDGVLWHKSSKNK